MTSDWRCMCCDRTGTPNNEVVSYKLPGGLLILCMTCWNDTTGMFLDALKGDADPGRGMH